MSHSPKIALFLERYESHPYGVYIEYYGRRCVAICAEANQLIPNTFLEVLDNQDIFYIVRPLFRKREIGDRQSIEKGTLYFG